MPKVTEADREKAHELMDTAGQRHEFTPTLVTALAAALAEEREKARAPFLALAQELASVACDHHASVAGDAYADAADRILAVLDGTYQ